MKSKIPYLVIIFVVAIIAVESFLYQNNHGRNHKMLKISGNIEATEVRVAFRLAGKIKELLTDEGRMVKAGDIIARLESDELTKIRAEAEAALKAAEYAYRRAEEDYARMENLFQAEAISAQKRDSAKTNADSAKANIDALRASLELAVTRLGFADLVSPIEGIVLTKGVERGEVVQAGVPVFTVADMKNIWLTAYINETDLGRVKLNQEVDIEIDTYKDKVYKGRIAFISQEAEFTPKQIQTTEERVKLVYRIKVMVENTNLELKPGMPADGYITE